MVALGLGTVWAGYYLFLYGYCLIRGYNVGFTDLIHPAWPGTAKPPAAKPAAGGGGGGRVEAQ